ncbi:MAG: ankyrin repeat domain-containing protein [Acidobacteria bacterium]|nr:ankyrin repeat domain-containing protein [Acidobacteriota bacterium]
MTALGFAAALAAAFVVEASGVLTAREAEARAVASHGTALADAARRGDAEAVRALLADGADADAPQSDGATALHWAAYRDDAEMVAALIRAGADVRRANRYGVTPLALAARNGAAEIITQLVAAGADPNDPRQAVRAGETPLMLAARSGKVAAVETLAGAGADVDAQETWNRQSALMWAAAEGHAPVVESLLGRGADIEARSGSGATALLFAARKGCLDCVRALLAAGADVNERRPDGATPLLVAVVNGHEDLVDLLLARGADPNAEGGSTRLTVQGMRARAVPFRIRKLGYSERESEGIVPGNVFGRPLQAAVHVANWHISDQFIVVRLDRMRVLRSLLAHGADVNGRNSMEEPRWSGARYRRHMTGATAFMLAAKAADVEVMRLLLEHGADPTIDTEDGITPLMAAAGISWASNQDRAGEAQVLAAVRLLVEAHGADVHAVSDVGETAMHAAAYRGANSVVQYLFDRGAALDVVALDGRTPLRVADGVEYGNSFAAHPHTAALLRELGAREIECPAPCAAAIPEEALGR